MDGTAARHETSPLPRARSLAALRVAGFGSGGGGLPIDNLTSQWFANLALDRLDHHVKEVLRAPGYLRYTDDFVLLANDKTSLRNALAAVQSFLEGIIRRSKIGSSGSISA